MSISLEMPAVVLPSAPPAATVPARARPAPRRTSTAEVRELADLALAIEEFGHFRVAFERHETAARVRSIRPEAIPMAQLSGTPLENAARYLINFQSEKSELYRATIELAAARGTFQTLYRDGVVEALLERLKPFTWLRPPEREVERAVASLARAEVVARARNEIDADGRVLSTRVDLVIRTSPRAPVALKKPGAEPSDWAAALRGEKPETEGVLLVRADGRGLASLRDVHAGADGNLIVVLEEGTLEPIASLNVTVAAPDNRPFV